MPILWNDRSAALGSTGDLVLADFDYYLIKDGSGPRVDISTEYKFTTDESCFRIVWYVDGNSWLSRAIPLEGSTSNTVSPIVVLK
ncbi:MAG: phage major capsid protein [Aliifodinibius sp.]|nr:phage major capsid protein [Fodinibius sp.]NIV09870.1 phage major capsid protein [Fodinibius sp.]NIY23409.1 phage major capsid protein [Fodinibius sp.]